MLPPISLCKACACAATLCPTPGDTALWESLLISVVPSTLSSLLGPFPFLSHAHSLPWGNICSNINVSLRDLVANPILKNNIEFIKSWLHPESNKDLIFIWVPDLGFNKVIGTKHKFSFVPTLDGAAVPRTHSLAPFATDPDNFLLTAFSSPLSHPMQSILSAGTFSFVWSASWSSPPWPSHH